MDLIIGKADKETTDYSQWQRKKKRSKSIKKNVTLAQNLECDIFGAEFSSSSEVTPKVSHRCRQQAAARLTVKPVDQEKERRIQALKAKITEKDNQIVKSKKKADVIRDENLTIRNNIDGIEGSTHAKVKSLLRKYEQYRGGILVMNNEFSKEKTTAQKDIQQIIDREKVVVKGLEEKVEEVQVQLAEQQKHLQLLLNYKDTEYPMKFLQKSELEYDIMQLQQYNQNDEAELKRVITSEVAKMRGVQTTRIVEVSDYQRDTVLASMHPSLMFMFRHNVAMKTEVKLHKENIVDLTRDIEELKNELKVLSKQKSTKDLRKLMFPDIFLEHDEICSPDMDIKLDIVRNKCLPI